MRCASLALASNVVTALCELQGTFDDYLGSRMGRAGWRSGFVARRGLGVDRRRAAGCAGWMDTSESCAKRNFATNEAIDLVDHGIDSRSTRRFKS